MRFELLPIELQHKIVSFSSFRTVLNLTRVSHALHKLCENVAIFRDLIENRNGHGGPAWKCPILSAETDLETWKRYALADERSDEFDARNRKDMRWLPHLIALGRSFAFAWPRLRLTIYRPRCQKGGANISFA